MPREVLTRKMNNAEIGSLGQASFAAASHMASLQCTIAQQERKIKALENQMTKKLEKGTCVAVKTEIKDIVEKRVWTNVKFIPDLKDLAALTKKVFGMMNLNEVEDDDGNIVSVTDSMASVYEHYVSYQLNDAGARED